MKKLNQLKFNQLSKVELEKSEMKKLTGGWWMVIEEQNYYYNSNSIPWWAEGNQGYDYYISAEYNGGPRSPDPYAPNPTNYSGY